VLKHITEPLPLPRSVRSDLPEEIERVILRAMAKAPDDRFQTAGEMVRALDAAVRASEAAARTARVVPAVAKAVTEPTAGAWTRTMGGVRSLLPTSWGRTAMWVAVGLVALLALYLALSRVPLRVQISGGQLEVVRVVEATPTETAAAVTTARPTSMPTATPSPQPTPVSTSMPGPTEVPSVVMPSAAAALRWERISDGGAFRRADVGAIAVDPQYPNVVYAATGPTTWNGGTGAGIYKSTDGGNSWDFVSAGIARRSFTALLVDPQDAQVIYAATQGEGVYKSGDGGATWRRLPDLDLVGVLSAISTLAMDPADNHHIYLLSTDDFYETTDAGESWRRLSLPCHGLALAVDPHDGNHLFLGSSNVFAAACSPLYESSDGGQTWSAPGAPVDVAAIWTLAVSPDNAQVVYAQHETAQYESALSRSVDGGKTWARLRRIDNQPGLAVSPSDPALLIAAEASQHANRPIYHSTDGGATWQTTGQAESGANAIVFAPGDPRVVYLASAGVYRSGDSGASWVLKEESFPVGYAELFTYPSDPDTLFAEDRVGGLYRSVNGGVSWERVDVGGFGLGVDRLNGSLYRANYDGLWRSTDRGQTWTDSPLPRDFFGLARQAFVNPADSQWVYLQSEGSLYISRDAGQRWQQAQEVERVWWGKLYFAASGQRVYNVAVNGSVYVSDDGGGAWKQAAGSANTEARLVVAAQAPSAPGVLLVALPPRQGVRKTTDGGQTWDVHRAGLGDLLVNTLAFDPTNADVVYAGSEGGAFVSTDGGESWSPINKGLGDTRVVYSIAVDPTDGSMVCALTPDGVFRLAGFAAD